MHSSIFRLIWFHFMAPYLGFQFLTVVAFQIFRLEHYLRDIQVICRNAHLLHQNWYCRRFTFEMAKIPKSNQSRSYTPKCTILATAD
jgi:hypothetical protein